MIEETWLPVEGPATKYNKSGRKKINSIWTLLSLNYTSVFILRYPAASLLSFIEIVLSILSTLDQV